VTDDPTALPATELSARIARRDLSAVDATTAYLERIKRLNPQLNAVIHVDVERALRAARRRDARGSPAGPLHGVPMTLKDSHRVAGFPTIVGNPDAPTRSSRTDGVVAARLRAAGAIVIGKTNVARDLGDFQTDNPVFGRTNHPSDPARTPGGSSGGAAAALAARLTPLEVGSDIAGSVRIPAAFCGVIGLKPTAGAIPLGGHVTEPVAHSRGGGVGAIATIGPMARTIDDIDLLLSVLTGRAGDEPSFSPGDLTLGVLPGLPGLRVAAEIVTAVQRLGESAALSGAKVEIVDPPMDARAMHDAYVRMYGAAARHGARWSTRTPGVHRLQQAVVAAWNDLLLRFDAILLPAAMCGPFPHRQTGAPIEVDGAPTPYWELLRHTEPFNLTGLPAISFPSPNDANGLPVGVQLVAAHGRDRWLVSAARWMAQGR
jgi:amidase